MSFTFNGINCETLGLYVEEYPQRVIPARKATAYSIHGRSGNLIVDQDAYENVTQEYKVFVKGSPDIQTVLNGVAASYIGVAGYQTLTDTYSTGIYRKARIVNATTFVNALNRYGKATIVFDCQPQRFPSPNEVLTGTLGGANIVYPVTDMLPAYPIIHVQGTIAAFERWLITIKNAGTVNSVAVSVSTGTAFDDLYIDYETRSVYTYLYNGPEIIGKVHPSRATFGLGDPVWEKLTNNAYVYTVLNAGTAHPISVETRRFYL